MQLSQPTLEPHSLCYTCWVQVVYSHLPPLLFSSCSFGDTILLLSYRRRGGVHPELPGVRGLLGGHLPVDVPVAPSFREFHTCFMLPHTLYQTFVIYVINNISTRFIISFYVICDVIYCSFCCIYVWLDPGTYMIARFMSIYKPGVTTVDAHQRPFLGVNLIRKSREFVFPTRIFIQINP